MQGDVLKEIGEILERLESLRGRVRSRALERAIEELRIAIEEMGGVKRKSNEGLRHYLAKVELLKRFEGSVYLEAEETGLSKIGYRPDAVVIGDDEIVIVEIETDPRRAIEKIEKIKRKMDKIKRSPITTNRRLRIVMGILGKVREELRRRAEEVGVEIVELS